VRDKVVAASLARQQQQQWAGDGAAQYALTTAGGQAGLSTLSASATAAIEAVVMPSMYGGSSMPVSDVNRQYAMMQAEQQMAQAGGDAAASSAYASLAALAPDAHATLTDLSRRRLGANGERAYDRNRSRLCAYFARGECTRGDECPFRHEMPREGDDPMRRQTMKDRYFGGEDPVAKRMLERLDQRQGGDHGGSGDGSGRRGPPRNDDPSATTLWVGALPDAADGFGLAVTEADLRTAFARFGDVQHVGLSARQHCAFVEFLTHEQADAAVCATYSTLRFGGVAARVGWARPKGGESAAPAGAGATDALLAAASQGAASSHAHGGSGYLAPLVGYSAGSAESTPAAASAGDSEHSSSAGGANAGANGFGAAGAVASWASALAGVEVPVESNGSRAASKRSSKSEGDATRKPAVKSLLSSGDSDSDSDEPKAEGESEAKETDATEMQPATAETATADTVDVKRPEQHEAPIASPMAAPGGYMPGYPYPYPHAPYSYAYGASFVGYPGMPMQQMPMGFPPAGFPPAGYGMPAPYPYPGYPQGMPQGYPQHPQQGMPQPQHHSGHGASGGSSGGKVTAGRVHSKAATSAASMYPSMNPGQMGSGK
jgi:hypothetical protein